MLKRSLATGLILIVAILLIACGPEPTAPYFVFTSPPVPTDTSAAVPTTVPTEFLTPEPTQTPVPTATPTPAVHGEKMYVTLRDGVLRVRSAPVNGEVIGYLLKNDVVLVLEQNAVSGWHKIQTYDGAIGYASANFLKPTHERAVLSSLRTY